VLYHAGIIDNIIYWQNRAPAYRHLPQLLINIANRALDPLHRIVWAEARGEDLHGQILVVNVIMNRSNDSGFPTGAYNVIHQPGQFCPVRNGSYNRATPGKQQWQAVEQALAGVDYSRGALFFNVAGINSWARRARPYLFSHGTHSFFG